MIISFFKLLKNKIPNSGYLCTTWTTATYPAIYHKRKILDIRLNIKGFSSIRVTRFELATTRPPDAYSNRAEATPVAFRIANIVYFSQIVTFLRFFLILSSMETIRTSHSGILRVPGQRLRRLPQRALPQISQSRSTPEICFGIRHPRLGQKDAATLVTVRNPWQVSNVEQHLLILREGAKAPANPRRPGRESPRAATSSACLRAMWPCSTPWARCGASPVFRASTTSATPTSTNTATAAKYATWDTTPTSTSNCWPPCGPTSSCSTA